MISAFDHPFLSGLLGDEELARSFQVESDIRAMLRFEVALATAQAELGIIPQDAAAGIAAGAVEFQPDMAALKDAVARDGVVVPELVRQLRQAVDEAHRRHVHYGATSQDVIDTSLMLRVATCLELLDARLSAIVAAMDTLAERFGSHILMGRTRMQAAIDITVGDRIAAWGDPLRRHLQRVEQMRPRVLVVQFGGAAGTLERFGEKGPALRAELASRLGLADAPQWHSQRDRIAELAGWLSQLSASLGKFGQDVALLAQDGGEIDLKGGGTSSAMPHKQNPVDAEVLVTLARFNAVQLAGIHQAQIHEQERSGAAWTLEWLILPQMLVAAGASTRIAIRLADRIDSLGR